MRPENNCCLISKANVAKYRIFITYCYCKGYFVFFHATPPLFVNNFQKLFINLYL